MMASQTPPNRPGAEGRAPDSSMQDILASIRRILSENEDAAPVSPPTPLRMTSAAEQAPKDDVLDLDVEWMVNDMTAHTPELAGLVARTPPSEAVPELIAPEAAQAAAASMTQLVRGIMRNRKAEVSRDGPTLEDLVREDIRPILKAWLETHLAPMVEWELRVELRRVSARVPF